jgi:predicted ATPase with chaperone activity
LLCDRVLPGFDLKSRSWGKHRNHSQALPHDGFLTPGLVQLDVAYCRPLKTNVRAIDNLVMPSERKDMIKALIQRFTSVEAIKGQHRTWAADFIENKGEGQIFLLHGSPGVGKTYVSSIPA